MVVNRDRRTRDPAQSPRAKGAAVENHLLPADDDVASAYGGYVAVCGAVMSVSGLPSACYFEVVADRNPRYCPECVREACRWSAEAGDRHLAMR